MMPCMLCCPRRPAAAAGGAAQQLWPGQAGVPPAAAGELVLVALLLCFALMPL